MKFGEFMAYHRKNAVGQLYLLAGEESYFLDKGRKRVFELLFPDGATSEDFQELPSDTSIGDLIMNASTVPFFTDRNVIVIRDWNILHKKQAENTEEGTKSKRGKATKAAPEDRLIEFLGNIPEFSTIVFISRKSVDKRRRLGKALVKYAITLEADPLRSYETAAVEEWLRGKLQELHKTMDREAIQYFLSAVSMMQTVSLGYLEQELNKLAVYMGKDEKHIDRRLLIKALSNIPEVSGFAMLNAISEHNTRRALYLLQRQVEAGTYPPVIVGLLVSHVRRLMQVKGALERGLKGKALATAVGGSGFSAFIAERLAAESKSFSNKQLKEAFLELADADYRMKTGRATPAELENIIISLCDTNQSK